MWPYPWTHVGTPFHLGHMDRVAATMPSQAHAGAAQEAPDIGQWEGQDVPLVRPSSCFVKGGIPSSRRYLPTYLPRCFLCCWGLCGVVLVVVMLLLVWSFGFRLGLWVGFWVGVRFGVEEDLIPEVRGLQCRVGGVPGVLPGCLGRLCGHQGAPGSLACGRSFGFGRGFADKVGGDGRIGG